MLIMGLGLLLFPLFLMSQSCYEELLNKGIEEKKAGNYETAVKQFLAALNCEDLPVNNELAAQIQETQRTWTTALIKEKENARKELNQRIEAENREKQERQDKILIEARGYRNEKKFREALKSYEEALHLNLANDTLSVAIDNTKSELIQYEFDRNFQIALALQEANHCLTALQYFDKALAGVPLDRRKEVQTAKQKCISE